MNQAYSNKSIERIIKGCYGPMSLQEDKVRQVVMEIRDDYEARLSILREDYEARIAEMERILNRE